VGSHNYNFMSYKFVYADESYLIDVAAHARDSIDTLSNSKSSKNTGIDG